MKKGNWFIRPTNMGRKINPTTVFYELESRGNYKTFDDEWELR
jgi:uncharacterized protein (DUF342 family)